MAPSAPRACGQRHTCAAAQEGARARNTRLFGWRLPGALIASNSHSSTCINLDLIPKFFTPPPTQRAGYIAAARSAPCPSWRSPCGMQRDRRVRYGAMRRTWGREIATNYGAFLT